MRAFQYQQIPVFSYPSVSTTVSRLTKKPTTGQSDLVTKEHDWDAKTQVLEENRQFGNPNNEHVAGKNERIGSLYRSR